MNPLSVPPFAKESLKDIWVNVWSLAIPSAFALYFASVRYVFELGYCHFFGIPTYLIQFEVYAIALLGVQIVGLLFNAASLVFVANLLIENVSVRIRLALSMLVLSISVLFILCFRVPYLIPALFASYFTLIIVARSMTVKDPKLRYATLAALLLLAQATVAQYLYVFRNLGISNTPFLPMLLAILIVYFLFCVFVMYAPSCVFWATMLIERRQIARQEKNHTGPSEGSAANREEIPLVVMVCVLIMFVSSYLASFGLGWLDGMSQKEHLYDEAEPGFLLAATYGDTFVFREVVLSNDELYAELGNKLQIRNADEIATVTFVVKPMERFLLPYKSPHRNLVQRLRDEIKGANTK